MLVKDMPYCGYTHSIGGLVFYVGKGSLARTSSLKGRNSLWLKEVEKAGEFDINIESWFDDEDAAFREERRLIMDIRPSCNIYNNEPPIDGDCYFSSNERMVYFGVGEWCHHRGMTQADLSRLSGESRQNISQSKRLGHLVIVNSKGEHLLVPASYKKAFQ